MTKEIAIQLIEESRGYWPKGQAMALMLLFGSAYGQGGLRSLHRSLEIANAGPRYAPAIVAYLINDFTKDAP